MNNKRIEELEAENAALKKIALELQWPARCYADHRVTYMARLVNDATRALLEMGLKPQPGPDGTIWARDGAGRAYDHLSPEEYAMGRTRSFDLREMRERFELIEEFASRVMKLAGDEGIESGKAMSQLKTLLEEELERSEANSGRVMP